MIQTCHHVMPNGLSCQSPAMRGSAFCYFHGRRIAPQRKQSTAVTRIEIPSNLDRNGVAHIIHQILNGLGNGSMSPRRASILIHGLQMAMENPPESDPEPADSLFDHLPTELQDKVNAFLGTLHPLSLNLPSPHPEKP
jgi:hypothetical protein